MGKMRLSALAASVSLLGGCAEQAVSPAYRMEECRRIVLVDKAAGEPVVGAEDLAVDPRTNNLIISAYDRRKVERAAKKRAQAIPIGGIYTVPIADIFDPKSLEIAAQPLVSRDALREGLRPHGVSFDVASGELAFINRGYENVDGQWKMTPSIQRIAIDTEPAFLLGEPIDVHCAANDVLATAERLFFSFDHGACDWRASLENIFNLRRSGFGLAGGGELFSKAAFANGLAQTADGLIVLAATRDRALFFLNEKHGAAQLQARLKLPGGPDNLSISYDDGVVTAAHPSMLRLALNRKLGIGRAPSRILKIDPASQEITLLYDDRSGTQFSAATVAIETSAGLIAGSVTDKGLLVCQAAE